MRSSSSAMSSLGLRPVTSKTCSALQLDDLGARIVVLVDAVAEAHQLALAFLHLLDVGGNVVFRSDLVQHAQHFFVGAAVQRAGQAPMPPRPRRDKDRSCELPTDAHGAGAAILLVIGMQDEENVERARDHRIAPRTSARPSSTACS